MQEKEKVGADERAASEVEGTPSSASQGEERMSAWEKPVMVTDKSGRQRATECLSGR